MLTLTAATMAAIAAQGQASYPDECCGLLIGRFDGDGRVALTAWPAPNEWTAEVALTDQEDAHSLRDRFYISPQTYLQAQRAAARQDLEIVGCYHTHPDDRAWPSERDRVGAAGVGGGPDFSFVVLAVERGTPGAIASALLSADGRQWIAEDLRIEEA